MDAHCTWKTQKEKAAVVICGERQYEKVVPEDYDQLLDIYEKNFDCADWASDILKKSLSRRGFIGIKLTDGQGEIKAVSLATRGLYLTHADSGVYQKLAIYTIGLDVYTGGMVYVDPRLRSRGIAGEMNVLLKRMMTDAGVELFFCEMAGDGVRFPGEVTCRYFETELCLGVYENYYKNAYREGRRACPICKCSPCRCAAKFYLFKVN